MENLTAPARSAATTLMRRRWEIGVGFVLALCTWPVLDLRNRGVVEGIDPSWRIGLHQIRIDGVHWGDQAVNTLGPLGFLAYPMLSGASTSWQSIMVFWGLHIVVMAVSFAILCRYLPLWAAAAVAYVVTAFGWNPMFERWLAPEAFAAAFAIVCFDRIATAAGLEAPKSTADPEAPKSTADPESPNSTADPESPKDSADPGSPKDSASLRFAAGLGVTAAVLMLVKLSAGLQAVVIGAATLCVLAWCAKDLRSGLRGLGVWFGALVLSYVVFWVGLGQPIAAMPNYVAEAVSMAGAYAGQMPVGRPELGWTLWAAFVVLAIFVAAAALRWRRLGMVDGAVALVPVLAFAYFSFKLGFVRVDYDHTLPFFLSVGVVAVAFCGRREAMGVAALVVAVGLGLGWAANGGNDSLWDRVQPFDEVAQSFETTRLVVDGSYRNESSDSLRAAAAGWARLDAETIERLSGKRVHVDPVDTSLLWIYEEFEWGAAPIFQSYLAYTPDFDELNAEWLRDDDSAPEFILRQRWAPDRRDPLVESPEYMKEMVCRYSQVGSTVYGKGRQAAEMAVLERGSDRCGDVVPVGERQSLVVGAVLRPIPSDACEGLLVYEVEGFASLSQRVRTTLYKDAIYTVRYGNDERPARFVPGTASQWHLLPDERLPEWASVAAPATRIRFTVAGSTWFTADNLSVQFGCLAFE